jgi:superfamily I DNA/RNA helicase
VSDRWLPVRRLAEQARAAVRSLATTESGLDVVWVALEARGLDVLRLAPGSPMLRGARAVFDADYVGYDRTLPDAQAAFALAHELGHAVLGHGEAWLCDEADIDETPVAERLPYGAGAVDAYNARQQRELEANVFAQAFLLPAEEVRRGFLDGASYADLAARFGVSGAACLTALAATLLAPLPPSGPPARGPAALPPLPAAEKPAEDLTPLDPSQRAAAELPAGPVLVNAGPGTGKTRTLVGRVLYLLARGVPARQILAVTFSNRATDEMRERLHRAAPEQAHALTVSTFHAFCLELLRRHHEAAGLPADFRVIDQVDAVVLLERHLGRLDLEAYQNLVYPELPLKDLVRAISRAKDELATPERYAELAAAARAAAEEAGDEGALKAAARWAEVARVYATYEALLAARGLLDFGGLIMRAVHLLRERPDVLAALRAEYRHVLVDEYQDMNRASAHLLRLLAGDGAGLWVVGDLRQAIYRFRGASPANVARFGEDFPGGRTVDLGVNYRADPHLVRLVSTAGAEMRVGGASPCDWQAFRPGGPPPRVWVARADDETAEANGIAAEVLRRRRDGRPFREQAVLVRTHGQAEPVAAALERAGVPALYLGDLFARGEVRDLLALLALAAGGEPAALLRVGAMPEHWLAREDRVRLAHVARERGEEFPGALSLAAPAGLDAGAVAAAGALHAALAGTGWPGDPWQLLARYLFGHGALLRRLLREAGAPAGGASGEAPGATPRGAGATQQLLAIGQLLAVARAYSERPLEVPLPDDPQAALNAFLGHVRRLVALDEDGARTPQGGDELEAVRILTVHAAKGLEFPVVYVPCLVQGRFPHRRVWDAAPPPPGLVEGAPDGTPSDEEGERLEETCLFFVAISRAKEELVLSRAERYGKRTARPSPFFALLEPFLRGATPAQLDWPGVATDGVVGGPDGVAASPPRGPLSIWQLERYLRCPRRYEYEYVLGFQEREELLGYKHFHDCVYHVLAEVRRGAAGVPPDPRAAGTLLAGIWQEEGPAGHAFEGLYRTMAERLIGRFCDQEAVRRGAGVGPPWREHLDVPLGGAVVRVPIDASEVLPDGTVRLVRTRTGRESDDDPRAERLSLLRAGAAGELGGPEQVQIELEYVATGATRPVRPPAARYEQQRLDALEGAVRGIRAGRFPARPREARDCVTCPFWIACPA